MVTRFEQFASSIANIYKQIQKIERDEMVTYGFKGSFAQYLLAIRRHEDGLTSSKLCEICDKDKAAISRFVAEMEEKGLLYRELQRYNRYRARLKLTEKGMEIANRLNERAKVAVEAAGKGLFEKDRQIFYSALDLISDNLHGICKNGIPEAEDV